MSKKIAYGNWFDGPWQNLRPGVNQIVFGMDAEHLCCTIGRVENGNEICPHSHPNEQIAMVLEGECDYYVDGTPYHLAAGSWITVPPNAVHYIHVYNSKVPCLQLNVYAPDRKEYKESYIRFCESVQHTGKSSCRIKVDDPPARLCASG